MAAIHDLEPMVHDGEEEEIFEAEKLPTRNDLIMTSTQNYIGNIWNLTKGSYGLMNDIGKSAVKLAKGELKAPPTSAPTTRFNNPVGPHRVIESAVFSLDDFKAIKNKTGTKINDVALAVIGGALRKYLDAHDEHPDKSLAASVPINMRTRTGDNGDANQVGAIFASLNSDIDNPIERILRIHKNTDEAKEFGEEAPLKDALKLVGALSPRVTKMLVNAYVDNKVTKHLPIKINTVISNVAGPNFPLYCSGAKLLNYHGVGVLTPGVGIFHLVFSYCGKLSVTILADRQMMPDPEFYRQCLEDSFADLQTSVGNASEEEIVAVKLKIDQEDEPAPKALEKPESGESPSEEQQAEKAPKEGKLIKAAPNVAGDEPVAQDAPKPKRKVAAKRKAAAKPESTKKTAARRTKSAAKASDSIVSEVISEEKKVS